MTRRIGRTLLAIAFGLSVVLLPARAGFAAAPPAMIGMADHQHHQHAPGDTSHSDKSQKPVGDCGSFIGCALSCGSFTGATASSIIYVPVEGAVLEPLRTSETILSQMGSPPFRPPRT
jgi:hypothetical protein